MVQVTFTTHCGSNVFIRKIIRYQIENLENCSIFFSIRKANHTQKPLEITLNLNAGLTQVLSDGTDSYLYGLGRIGEYQATWAYYLPDALGSVRQMVYPSGTIEKAQSFDPYGELLTSEGDEESNYGFTGEWTDATGLQHLRARYLDTNVGRFTAKDTWGGDYNWPMSLNGWLYVGGNPVNWIDPTGHIITNEICEDWGECFYTIKGATPSRPPNPPPPPPPPPPPKNPPREPIIDDPPGEYPTPNPNYSGGLSGNLTMCDLDRSMCGLPQPDEAESVIKELTLYTKVYQIVEEYGHSLAEPNSPNANDCEGMCQIIEYAAKIYHDDPDEFLDQLTYIFNGVVDPGAPALMLYDAYRNETFEAIGRAPNADGSGYFFIDTGFYKKFQDDQNQLFHVWPFIVSTSGWYRYWGETISMAGNIWHELTDKDPTGRSWADFFLGIEGMKIGTEWWMKGRDPDELADIVREHLCQP